MVFCRITDVVEGIGVLVIGVLFPRKSKSFFFQITEVGTTTVPLGVKRHASFVADQVPVFLLGGKTAAVPP